MAAGAALAAAAAAAAEGAPPKRLRRREKGPGTGEKAKRVRGSSKVAEGAEAVVVGEAGAGSEAETVPGELPGDRGRGRKSMQPIEGPWPRGTALRFMNRRRFEWVEAVVLGYESRSRGLLVRLRTAGIIVRVMCSLMNEVVVLPQSTLDLHVGSHLALAELDRQKDTLTKQMHKGIIGVSCTPLGPKRTAAMTKALKAQETRHRLDQTRQATLLSCRPVQQQAEIDCDSEKVSAALQRIKADLDILKQAHGNAHAVGSRALSEAIRQARQAAERAEWAEPAKSAMPAEPVEQAEPVGSPLERAESALTFV
jgi:hypothetical protein